MSISGKKVTMIIDTEQFCKYIHRYCNQRRIEGYDYCIRHILEDKSAPFRQCTYVQQPSKRRCTNAAPKSGKNDKRDSVLCPYHVKQAILKAKASQPKRRHVQGPVALLRSLEHYCTDVKHDPMYDRSIGTRESYNNAPYDSSWPESLIAPGATEEKKVLISHNTRPITTLDEPSGWIESPGDELRYAGVLTSKEVVNIARKKTLRLQTLYCQQLKDIWFQLSKIRRDYSDTLKKESQDEESDSSLENYPEIDLKKIRALLQYHRPSGVERLMRYRSKQKHAGADEIQKGTQCIFVDNGKQCDKKAVVLSNFCFSHILSDPNQVMFQPCCHGPKRDCNVPVIPIEEIAACSKHMHLTLLKPKIDEDNEDVPSSFHVQEQEPFHSMDDIASLGLDLITPGSLFGLDQFGEPGESTDTALSEDQEDFMQIQPIPLKPPSDILCDSRKSESEEEK